MIDGRNSVSFAQRSEGHLNIAVAERATRRSWTWTDRSEAGDAEEAFRNQVQQLLDNGTTHIAVNLAGVTELDSSGIGALVRAFTTLKRAGGKTTYFAANKRVMMLLKMVRLDSILDLAEDEAAALARI